MKEFFTTLLVRGGEGKSKKINKMSLEFVLFLFQNKQSNGGKGLQGLLELLGIILLV